MQVKRWTHAHGLANASRGFLNSFGWALWLIVSLQVCEPPVLPPLSQYHQSCRTAVGAGGPLKNHSWRSRNTWSEGRLLFHFFAWSTTRFNPEHHCISAFHGSLRSAHTYREVGGASAFVGAANKWLCVEDPIDHTDNVARGVQRNMLTSILKEMETARCACLHVHACVCFGVVAFAMSARRSSSSPSNCATLPL